VSGLKRAAGDFIACGLALDFKRLLRAAGIARLKNRLRFFKLIDDIMFCMGSGHSDMVRVIPPLK